MSTSQNPSHTDFSMFVTRATCLTLADFWCAGERFQRRRGLCTELRSKGHHGAPVFSFLLFSHSL